MSSENENPDSQESASKKNDSPNPDSYHRVRREPSPFRKLLPIVFLAVIALTIYFYLDQNVFAPNRPLVWQSANADKLESSFRTGKVVVAAVGQFDSKRDSRAFIDRIDVPVLRKEAHRFNSEFVVLQLESETSGKKPNREFIAEKLSQVPSENGLNRPFFLILYRKLPSPIRIESDTGTAEKIAAQLSTIRRGDYEK
jgi:hypothetical protein